LSVTVVLQWVQATLFVALAAAALTSFARQRSAPAAYVAAAFAAMGGATLSGRVTDVAGVEPPELIGDLTLVAVVAFPWLLAAFAWSFSGRLPTWLRVAGVATAVLAVVAFPLPPLGDAPDRTQIAQLYVAAVLVSWLLLTAAAAGHLWMAGRGQRVVRARTRLLALGAVVLALALLVAGTGGDSDGLTILVNVAAISSALLFAAGLAPPAFLRMYWRQLPNARWHEMQSALIAARTPEEAAEAVVPVLADTFGGGALCTDSGDVIVARDGIDGTDADDIAARIARGETEIDGVEVTPVDRWHLAVQTSPYAPLFGEDEEGLLRRFGGQLRLAIQRADLYVAHREARRQVEASSEELQALLIGLAHDLRSPAVTISTYAALIGDSDDPDDVALMVEGLRDGSAYLDRLVDGLLSLSRIGRNDGEPEPVALEEVISGVARRLAAAYPALEVTTSGDLPVVCVDRLRIEQVVDNLLGNAAKHGGREDLTVTVTWSPDREGGTLVFADDGRGVSEAEREHVFGLFRRGSSSAAGSGVGLGLVRRIVDNLGGSIRLAPSDRGALVEVRLPTSVIVERSPSGLVRRDTRTDTDVGTGPGADAAPGSVADGGERRDVRP
jgi:signal transduction histidine kinase